MRKKLSRLLFLSLMLPFNLLASTQIINEITPSDSIFEIASQLEKQPQYPGGFTALYEYLSKNLIYPDAAREMAIQGKVICQFVVNSDGSIVDITVVRSVNPLLDKEAIRVLSNMPAWTPGEINGKKVRVKYTLPISFKLTK